MGHLIPEADSLHRRTRAQALADGSLRDLTAEAREAGFLRPVLATVPAYALAVASSTDGAGAWELRRRRSRLVILLRRALAGARPGQREVRIQLRLIRERPRPEVVQLRAVSGPGDILIKIPGEH